MPRSYIHAANLAQLTNPLPVSFNILKNALRRHKALRTEMPWPATTSLSPTMHWYICTSQHSKALHLLAKTVIMTSSTLECRVNREGSAPRVPGCRVRVHHERRFIIHKIGWKIVELVAFAFRQCDSGIALAVSSSNFDGTSRKWGEMKWENLKLLQYFPRENPLYSKNKYSISVVFTWPSLNPPPTTLPYPHSYVSIVALVTRRKLIGSWI